MSTPESEVETEGPDDGPLILEPGDCCAGCHYSVLETIPNHIQRVRLCKRLPPIPMLVPVRTAQGTGMTMASNFPVVNDSTVCYEFEERLEPEVIPTGLISNG